MNYDAKNPPLAQSQPLPLRKLTKYEIFMQMLGELKGRFTPVKDDPLTEKQKARQHRKLFARHMARPLDMTHYTQGRDGVIRRRTPKRDKSVSARQARIQRKAARRAA